MRSLLIAIIPFVYLTFFHSFVNSQSNSTSTPISHDVWNQLLADNVSNDGTVNYRGFIADSTKFNVYLNLLESNHPNELNWSYNERKAYWINAYNAFTVQLILKNYPVESIKDLGGKIYKVNTPWDKRFIIIEGKDYDLNNIEHDILRKEYSDPRIHFAVNCASISCPRLKNEAYYAESLEQQLDENAQYFINNKSKNSLSKSELELSRIFKWFSGDFTEDQKLIEFLNRYSTIEIDADAAIKFKDYNWKLNE